MVGTSASAPHVAGAAALLIEQARASGQPGDPATITKQLEDSALDMGPPGPDNATGYGRLRLDLVPPAIVSTIPAAGADVHGTLAVGLVAADDGTLAETQVVIDGTSVMQAPGMARLPWSSRGLADGPHTALFAVRDMAGNLTTLQVPFTIDNTAPVIVAPPLARTASTPPTLEVRDAGGTTGRALVRTVDRHGQLVQSLTRALTFVDGEAPLSLPPPGDGLPPFRVSVRAVDAAGNVSRPRILVLRAGRT
jgi:hypothetical protein